MATHDTTTTELTVGGALFNAEKAAQYLSVSTSYIRKIVASKRIAFVKIGTRTLFRQSDLDEWISERVVRTNEEVRNRSVSLASSLHLQGGRR